MRGVVALLVAGFLFVSISVIYPTVRSEEPVGNILYVGGSGLGNYTALQDAIDNSSDGGTVFVYDDSSPYYENIVVTKSINLIGEDKNTTIIDGRIGIDYPIIKVFNIDAFKITGFTVQNSIGVELGNSINYTITKNLIYNCTVGILSYCLNCSNIGRNNNITENIIKNCNTGIYLAGSYNNTISENEILDCSHFGIYLFVSSDNTVFHNNFINNTQNAYDDGNNSWDNGQHGNYWNDYNGNDKNNDGIGDTPYNIPGGNNQDRYPLMMPYDGTIRLKEFYVDYGSVFTMLIIGMIIIIIFLLPIAYIWYKKGWR